MSERKYTLKNKFKIESYQRFNSASISNKIKSKLKSLSRLSSAVPLSHKKVMPRSKLFITNILSTSKNLIINGNRPESSKDNFNKIRYEYPYEPRLFLKLENNQKEKELILSNKLNLLTRNKKQKNVSFESSVSTFKSSSNYSSTKYKTQNLIFNNNINNYCIGKNTKLTLMTPDKKVNKITKRIFLSDKNSNLNDSFLTNDYTNITKELFLKYIDDINVDKNNILKNKYNLSEYFLEDNNNKHIYYLKELLDTHKYNEQENEDFFLTDFYSAKTTSLNIKDINIILKLSSLKLYFYEITSSNETKKNNNINIIYNNNILLDTKKYILNTKIKFPFEFLSIFYGLNYEEFINLLLSLIDYNYDKNKFFIDYNNFINRIEDAKTLYDFFTEKSFANNYENTKAKEFFLYDWDVKDINNNVKHFRFKILLPQMKLEALLEQKTKMKFYSYIDIKTMDNIIKNSFNKWDYYLLIKFSENKLFRYEINKIICGKYSNSKSYSAFNRFKTEKKLSYNLTNAITKINTIKKNYTAYNFFYSYIKDLKTEVYFINFKLPKITISHHSILSSFDKEFELDFRILYQLNKLRKYFLPEDLIKYNMTVKKLTHRSKRENQIMPLKQLLSAKTMKPFKRSSARMSLDNKPKHVNVNIKKLLKKRIKIKNELNNDLLQLHPKLSKNLENEEIIKDVKLNLDKNILNFDESILKFINYNDIHKNDSKIIDNESNNNNNNNKLNINIGNIELIWTNKDALTNEYQFDKKITQYLLDFHPCEWRNYVENNIEKIILGNANNQGKKKKKSFFHKGGVHF